MDKNCASGFNCIADEAHRVRQMLAYVFPWYVHNVEDFVSNFLATNKSIKVSRKCFISKINSYSQARSRITIDLQMGSMGSILPKLVKCG